MDGELVVRGVGEVTSLPDLASVRVSVEGEASSRDEAYQGAAAAAGAVDRVLSDFQAATGRVTTAALSVQPKTRWRKGETQQTGWTASRVSVVEVRDTSQVGELLNALAGAGGAIAGLSWEVAPTNDAFSLSRRRAGEDARARAEDYARALGVELGAVAWASEPGLRGPSAERVGGWRAAAALGAPAAEEPITVTPEEVTIRAELDVGYRIG